MFNCMKTVIARRSIFLLNIRGKKKYDTKKNAQSFIEKNSRAQRAANKKQSHV